MWTPRAACDPPIGRASSHAPLPLAWSTRGDPVDSMNWGGGGVQAEESESQYKNQPTSGPLEANGRVLGDGEMRRAGPVGLRGARGTKPD